MSGFGALPRSAACNLPLSSLTERTNPRDSSSAVQLFPARALNSRSPNCREPGAFAPGCCELKPLISSSGAVSGGADGSFSVPLALLFASQSAFKSLKSVDLLPFDDDADDVDEGLKLFTREIIIRRSRLCPEGLLGETSKPTLRRYPAARLSCADIARGVAGQSRELEMRFRPWWRGSRATDRKSGPPTPLLPRPFLRSEPAQQGSLRERCQRRPECFSA